MNYIDFPILTDLQYKQLNQQYGQNNQSEINNLFDSLSTCKLSLSFFNGNATLKKTLTQSEKELSNILETLNLFYPKHKIDSKTVLNNIFTILKELSNSIKTIISLKTGENKKVYTHILQKIETQLTDILSNILNTLSNQNIKLFSHM